MNSHFQKDRKLAGPYRVKTPLRVRVWKSAMPEHEAVAPPTAEMAPR